MQLTFWTPSNVILEAFREAIVEIAAKGTFAPILRQSGINRVEPHHVFGDSGIVAHGQGGKLLFCGSRVIVRAKHGAQSIFERVPCRDPNDFGVFVLGDDGSKVEERVPLEVGDGEGDARMIIIKCIWIIIEVHGALYQETFKFLWIPTVEGLGILELGVGSRLGGLSCGF